MPISSTDGAGARTRFFGAPLRRGGLPQDRNTPAGGAAMRSDSRIGWWQPEPHRASAPLPSPSGNVIEREGLVQARPRGPLLARRATSCASWRICASRTPLDPPTAASGSWHAVFSALCPWQRDTARSSLPLVWLASCLASAAWPSTSSRPLDRLGSKLLLPPCGGCGCALTSLVQRVAVILIDGRPTGG